MKLSLVEESRANRGLYVNFSLRIMKQAASFLVITLLGNALAGALDFEAGKDLPSFNGIYFSSTSVGFESVFYSGSSWYIYARQTEDFQPIGENDFRSEFGPELLKDQSYETFHEFKASDGSRHKELCGEIDLTVDYGWHCNEGIIELENKKVRIPFKRVSTVGNFCAVEKVGSYFWVGTCRKYTESRPGPSEGIFIVTSDGDIKRHITSLNGLTQDVVNLMKRDPFGKRIWVTSHIGFNQITEDGDIVDTKYFVNSSSNPNVKEISISKRWRN